MHNEMTILAIVFLANNIFHLHHLTIWSLLIRWIHATLPSSPKRTSVCHTKRPVGDSYTYTNPVQKNEKWKMESNRIKCNIKHWNGFQKLRFFFLLLVMSVALDLGALIHNFQPEPKRRVRILEKVSLRRCKTERSLLFNSICVKEHLLPNPKCKHPKN